MYNRYIPNGASYTRVTVDGPEGPGTGTSQPKGQQRTGRSGGEGPRHTGRRPGPEFFLSLAGGTPAVCVGRAPDGLRPEQGVFETKNLTEAMSLIKLLTSNAACWQQASDRALAFARAGQAAFAAQFGKLFP